MKQVNLGIIGCGTIGRLHAQSAAADPNINFVAVADLDEGRAKEIASEFNVPKVYGHAQTLLEDEDVDAVVLALITGVRAEVANEALRRKKHVLLEKPPAMNADEIREYMKLADGMVVGCCSSRLCFLDGAGVARSIVDRGDLGEIRVVRCRGIGAVGELQKDFTRPPWRVSHILNGGGYLVNWGVYDLNYLMHVTGWQLEPETVMAQAWPIAPELAPGRVDPGSDAENHVVLFIRCKNGAVITLERGEAVAMEGEMAWQVTGERGSLRLHMVRHLGSPVVVLDRADPVKGLQIVVELEDPGESVEHSRPVGDFAEAIQEGRQPMTDLPKTLVLQQIIDAAYRSAETGEAVRIGT